MNIEQIREKIPLYAKRAADVLLENGFEAYLVGGSVRDIMLGKEPSDFDIATDADPDQMQKIFPKTVATGAKFGTITVIVEDRQGERIDVEVTTYRSESDYIGSRWPSKVEFTKRIDEDLKRRDFTINALAINFARLHETSAIVEDIVLDLFEGMKDIEQRIIRAVGDPKERFSEDALRTLRACRLASQLDFEIEENTFGAIGQVIDAVDNLSVERIRDELLKILYKSPRPSKGFDLLRLSGLLELFIPELLAGIGVEQPEYHVDDVYTHTLKVVDLAQDEVKVAALLHDIAKPSTKSVDDKGVHFYHHDVEGANVAEKIMRRLKFPKKEIEKVSLLIKHHMFYYPSADWRKGQEQDMLQKKDLEELRREGDAEKIVGGWTDAAVRRFLSRVGGVDNVNDLIKLRIADATANPKSTFTNYEIKALQERISRIIEQEAALKLTDLDIDGNDLIELGVEKGPQMGEILNFLLEYVLDNPEVNSKEKLSSIVKEEFLK